MITRRLFVAASLATAFVHPARAQTFPDRLIKMIVPFAPGGPVDVMARLVAQHLSTRFGQPVIVENRPGAGGTIASKAVATADPDGYTLLFASAGSLAISPSLYRNIGYDPVGGFAPVAIVANHPLAMVVHPNVPVTSVKELIAYAKANPGKLNFGAAPGTPPHLMGELFRSLTGIEIVFVPYKGAAPALTDLLAGQTQMTMLPTMQEVGFAGFPQGSWTGVVAPAGTPREVVAKLHDTINDGLRAADLRDHLAKLGAETKLESAEDFAALLAEELRKWAEVIKSSGATVN